MWMRKPTCNFVSRMLFTQAYFTDSKTQQVLSRKWEKFGLLCVPTTRIKIQNIPSSPLKVPWCPPLSNPHLPKPQGTTDASVTRNKVLLIHGRQGPRSTGVHPPCAVLFSACFSLVLTQSALQKPTLVLGPRRGNVTAEAAGSWLRGSPLEANEHS